MKQPAVYHTQTTAGKMTKTSWFKYMVALCIGVCLLFGFGFQMQAQALPRETRSVKVTEKIPFDTDYVELPGTYRGYTEQVASGVMGEKEIECQVLFEGGVPVKLVGVKTTELARPINEVVRVGAKVLKSQTADGTPWKVSFAHPLKGRGWLSADYYDYKGHNGIDIAAPYGTPVYAAAEGTVTLAGWYGEYGYCVIIDHADGSQTLYAHNSALQVKNGQKVKQGERVASVGTTGNSTGNHLHLELRANGKMLDPLIYLDQ